MTTIETNNNTDIWEKIDFSQEKPDVIKACENLAYNSQERVWNLENTLIAYRQMSTLFEQSDFPQKNIVEIFNKHTKQNTLV